MKTIVTHIGPDLDAITSIWLIKTYFPEWKEAVIAFVPAGQTLGGLPPDADPEIWHVDTGMGKFDHHQDNRDTCAAKLVYEEVERTTGPDEALNRLVTVVNDVDHFRQVTYPEPAMDYWYFGLETLIDGWRLLYADNPLHTVELVCQCLDSVYRMLRNKIWAERELAEKGIVVDTPWGKAIGVTSVNDEVVPLAQKQGFAIAVRKDTNRGYLRIKARPDRGIDLEQVYDRLKSREPEATWFLHASHHMILNGSSKNPAMKPSTRPLSEIMEELSHG